MLNTWQGENLNKEQPLMVASERIFARQVGLVPSLRIDGVVHSIYAQTINLQQGDQIVMALTHEQKAFFPRVIGFSAADFSKLNNFSPTVWTLNADTLLLFRGSACLEIDLSVAKKLTFDPGFSGKNPTDFLQKNQIEDLYLQVLPYLSASIWLNHSHDLHQEAHSRLAVFWQQLLSEQDAAKLKQAVLSLVGFGEGLTPSGDDYLVGVMLAAKILNQNIVRQRLSAILQHSLHLTTDVSAFFLQDALGDLFAAPLLALARNLIVNGQIDPDAMSQILAFGHTSGIDMLTGFFTGIFTFSTGDFYGCSLSYHS